MNVCLVSVMLLVEWLLLQPAALCSVRLTCSNPEAWIRLEALSVDGDEILARTAGRSVATFIALPTPAPAVPEEPPAGAAAAAGPAKGGAAAAKGKGAPAVPTEEEAAAAYAADVYKIKSNVKADATIILQGSIETSRWEPWPQLASPSPVYDDASVEAQLTWALTLACGVGSFEVWPDIRWQEVAKAERRRWEAVDPVSQRCCSLAELLDVMWMWVGCVRCRAVRSVQLPCAKRT